MSARVKASHQQLEVLVRLHADLVDQLLGREERSVTDRLADVATVVQDLVDDSKVLGDEAEVRDTIRRIVENAPRVEPVEPEPEEQA